MFLIQRFIVHTHTVTHWWKRGNFFLIPRWLKKSSRIFFPDVYPVYIVVYHPYTSIYCQACSVIYDYVTVNFQYFPKNNIFGLHMFGILSNKMRQYMAKLQYIFMNRMFGNTIRNPTIYRLSCNRVKCILAVIRQNVLLLFIYAVIPIPKTVFFELRKIS